VINDQERDGADNRHKRTIKIQNRDTGVSEQIGEESTDNCPDNAQEDVAVPPVTRPVYKFAADVSGDRTQNYPGDEREGGILSSIGKEETGRGYVDH
jgi:hypothetical protein